MAKQAHTPGQLEVVMLGPSPIGVGIPEASGCYRMVANPVHNNRNSYNRADMARIALTWNCHDDLLAVVETLCAHLDDANDHGGLTERSRELWDAAQKAVQKARGK